MLIFACLLCFAYSSYILLFILRMLWLWYSQIMAVYRCKLSCLYWYLVALMQIVCIAYLMSFIWSVHVALSTVVISPVWWSYLPRLEPIFCMHSMPYQSENPVLGLLYCIGTKPRFSIDVYWVSVCWTDLRTRRADTVIVWY